MKGMVMNVRLGTIFLRMRFCHLVFPLSLDWGLFLGREKECVSVFFSREKRQRSMNASDTRWMIEPHVRIYLLTFR